MTITTAPLKPELEPFRDCPPEVTPEQCTRIQVAVRALDDITERRFKPGVGYFVPSDCSGCMLGSLAFAMVEGRGEELWEVNVYSTFSYFVGKVFGRDQASLMERAYEGWHTPDMFKKRRWPHEASAEDAQRNRSYRMRSILSNVILNQGTFDPTTRVEPIA